MKHSNNNAVMDLNFALWRMGFEAPSVIAMRTMGAAGWWTKSDTENEMMVDEKQDAFAKGMAQASLAMWKGASPATVMLEAIKPVQAQTGSNNRRLTKSGPRIPGVSR
ncbi:MAG: hypothetical protein AB8B88_10910 [Devosiaceae bacterium]